MTELEFEQRVREYYSKYTGKMPNWEEYQKLKSAALKYNFDLDKIWKKLQENEKILKDVIQNRNVEDPITDELSEGFIEQYIAKGICSNYILHLKSEKNRGKMWKMASVIGRLFTDPITPAWPSAPAEPAQTSRRTNGPDC